MAKDYVCIGNEFVCLECGEKLDIDGAELAMEEGCPECGGSDIDIAV